MTLHKPST